MYIYIYTFVSKESRVTQNTILYRLRIQASVFKLLCLSPRTQQTMELFCELSVCVSGKVASWSNCFDIRLSVTISYLKLWNYKDL